MTDGRERYDFWKRRAGDVVNIATADDRRRMVSAFGRWNKSRLGTLKMTTRAEGSGFVAEFTGISHAEVVAARIANVKDEI